MKLGISLPEDLVSFADEEAESRGTTRSGFLAELLQAEQQQKQLRTYLDQHGWDVVEDAETWREYQQSRMSKEYGADDW